MAAMSNRLNRPINTDIFQYVATHRALRVCAVRDDWMRGCSMLSLSGMGGILAFTQSRSSIKATLEPNPQLRMKPSQFKPTS